jgi:hypothetical protein
MKRRNHHRKKNSKPKAYAVTDKNIKETNSQDDPCPMKSSLGYGDCLPPNRQKQTSQNGCACYIEQTRLEPDQTKLYYFRLLLFHGNIYSDMESK